MIVLLLAALLGCDLVPHPWDESLALSATTASLGVGESVRVNVRRQRWFRTTELTDPSRTRFGTTSESMLVVEPDGWVTCVGTYGRPHESAWVTARHGNAHGHLSMSLRSHGPGPTLDLVPLSSDLPELPGDARSGLGSCCPVPLALRDGQTLRFAVRARASGRDLTSTATGTRYTLFFGSGQPNDSHPEIVTGGPPVPSAKTFQLDPAAGTMTAPASIQRLNRASVVVFVRNQALVGWRQVVIVHR